MMLTIFIEYKVEEHRRAHFLTQLSVESQKTEALGASNYRCYEGLDQPNLFVETFDVETTEQYLLIKAGRLEDQSFCENIAGGSSKVHVWAFRPHAF